MLLRKLNRRLKGQPDTVLTAVLLIAAIVMLIVAFRGSPVLKGVIAAWILVP